jgi:hypothetical protein
LSWAAANPAAPTANIRATHVAISFFTARNLPMIVG